MDVDVIVLRILDDVDQKLASDRELGAAFGAAFKVDRLTEVEEADLDRAGRRARRIVDVRRGDRIEVARSVRFQQTRF